jgi:hypothetical protein
MNNNRGFLYFFLGCASGIAVSALIKSRTGRDSVEYLREAANKRARGVKARVENLGDAVNNAATRAAKAVRYQAENVGAAVDAGKEAYREAQQTTP